MRYFLSLLVALAWGLWFGGLVCTFLFIQRLFDTMSALSLKSVFDQVAPGQFTLSERFELVVGMLALAATAGLYLVGRRGAVAWLFGVFAVTAGLAMYKAILVTPKMLKLIVPGTTPTDQFRKLHGLSMGLGSLEVLLLLIAGAALPAAFAYRKSTDGTP